MALERADFREIGGVGNSDQGGQTYSAFSATDTLATMMASGYLDAFAYIMNVRDTVLLSGSDFSGLTRVATNTGTVVTVLPTDVVTGVAATLSGAGAVPITSRSVDLTSTSTDAWTLADGAVGQLLNITMVVDGGTAVLTPANALGWSTCTFADAGDSVQLEFKSGGWAAIGQAGLSTGPVIA